MTGAGLSGWGRAGLALFGVHALLLFFPPIPPDVKGSLWSYLAGYTSVGLLLVESARRRPAVALGWSRAGPVRRWVLGLVATFGALAVALAVRRLDPALFLRFSAEDGLWEPLTLFCYLGSALFVAGLSGELRGAGRKHWRLVAGLYALLALEEVDYFGIFGGVIGHVQGIYAGSLHDLVRLAGAGVVSPLAWAALGAAVLVVAAGLRLAGYLQPRAILSMVGSLDFVWAGVGLGFLFAGAALEAGLFGWTMAEPTLEEALEFAGAIALAVYALQVAGGASDVTSDSIRSSASSSSALGRP